MNRLYIISGPPATGKSSLAKLLSEELSIPVLSKDAIKEELFDSLGIRDRKWSQELGKASISLIFSLLRQYLKTGVDIIVECNFNPDYANKDFKNILEGTKYEVIETLLYLDNETILTRFRDRNESGRRHAGHMDSVTIEKLPVMLESIEHRRLDISDVFYEFDMKEINDAYLLEIVSKLRSK